ncbi:MAG: hypothetical protein KDE22_18930, partial [Rhodobacterales bacterium]|nr:hypothetical protein [Rhodobacterales bacterium]
MIHLFSRLFSRRADLPLDRDGVSRFLPWLVAFMVFLAVLVLAGVLVLDGLAERWVAGAGDTLTVQIMPAETDNPAGDPAVEARNLEAVLGVLRAHPALDRVAPIPRAQVLDLLEPWLGAVSGADLPLPQLVDVGVRRGAHLDLDALRLSLNRAAPGVAVDDHGVWLGRLVRLVRLVEALGAVIIGLVGLVTAATVVFTTRMGLAVHREAIEVLHLIGAQDSYIARQFAAHALRQGLRGGLIGLALALAAMAGIAFLVRDLNAGLVTDLGLGVGGWLVVALVPVLVAALATATARVSMARALARML